MVYAKSFIECHLVLFYTIGLQRTSCYTNAQTTPLLNYCYVKVPGYCNDYKDGSAEFQQSVSIILLLVSMELAILKDSLIFLNVEVFILPKLQVWISLQILLLQRNNDGKD